MRIFLIFLFLGFIISVNSQTIERSKITETINNKKVYVHTVKAGETIYGLCRLYNCSEEDIKALNPGSLVNGISIEQKLYLPYSEQAKPRTFSNNSLNHTVEKGETMYGISKKYGISISELLAKNPFLTDGIKIGQILTIPIIQNENISKNSTKTTPNNIPVVKKEALFPNVDSQSTKPIVNQSIQNNCDSLILGKSASIAMIFPLYIKQNDSITLSDSFSAPGGTPTFKNQESIFSKSLTYLELYEGALLALDSLKKLGYTIQLHIYDSKSDIDGIDNILKRLSTQNIDLIIGSNDQSEFEKIAAFAKKKGIPAVSPLSTNLQLATDNKMVILANTPLKCRLQAEAVYSLSLKQKKYVFVHAGHVNEIENIEQIKRTMLPAYKNDTAFMNKHVKVVRFSTYSMAKFEKAMDSNLNIVIIPSEDQAFVNDVLTKINIYKRRYNIELHGMAIWENYKNLELDYLFDLHFKCPVSTFRDYSNPKVKSFVSKFRSIYKNEPSKLSFLGFDILMYFGEQSAKYGKKLTNCGMQDKYEGLQNSFTFTSMGQPSGFFNSYVSILEYAPEYKRITHPINLHMKSGSIEPSEKKTTQDKTHEDEESE